MSYLSRFTCSCFITSVVMAVIAVISQASSAETLTAQTVAAQNTAVVEAFYDLAFNQKQPELAVKRYGGERYIQHNPQVGDGWENFIGFVKGFTQQNPGLKAKIVRTVAEGNLVTTHVHITFSDNDQLGMSAIDIFRLENGKIVEHWDVLQPVPESSANNNTMF